MHRSFFAMILAGVAAASALVAGCGDRKQVEPPPRATDVAPVPQESSLITVPIDADQQIVTRLLEREVPRTLWTIDQHFDRCIAPQKVKLFGASVKVTPPIGCTIIGKVTRGSIRLHGEGRELVAAIPLHAAISARDIGGVLKGETATGAAMVYAHILLGVTPQWKATGSVKLRYDWQTPPGIDFLGQRITFTDRADEKLQPIMRQLEGSLPRELDRVDLRSQVEGLWKRSFTSLALNEKNPPVWLRITPRKLIYDSYSLHQGRLRLRLGLEAMTETHVGQRPPDPSPVALPPLARSATDGQLHFFLPVIADYAQLEPVILRALVRRAERPFVLPGLGPIAARFDKVTAYGTTEGRIALGIVLAARPVSGAVSETRGLIWLTARAVNAPGSARIDFRDLQVTGDTDGLGGDMLLQLVDNPAISAQIAASLTQNFSHDVEDLLGKIRRAVAARREGEFVLGGTVDTVEIGTLGAYGNGLYLPVRATGKANISYRP